MFQKKIYIRSIHPRRKKNLYRIIIDALEFFLIDSFLVCSNLSATSVVVGSATVVKYNFLSTLRISVSTGGTADIGSAMMASVLFTSIGDRQDSLASSSVALEDDSRSPFTPISMATLGVTLETSILEYNFLTKLWY